MPARRMISTVNSCHEQAPELVRCTSPVASRSSRLDQGGREIAGECWAEALVGDHPKPGATLARAGDHPLDEVAALRRAPVHSVQARGPHDEAAVAVRQRGVLAGELRERIHAARAGRVVLGIRPAARAVEHVVRAQMDQPSARLLAVLGETLDRPRVDRERAVLVGLAHLDVVERRAVEDQLGAERVERPPDGLVIADVELRSRRRGDITPAREQLLDVRRELTAAAGDEDRPHLRATSRNARSEAGPR